MLLSIICVVITVVILVLYFFVQKYKFNHRKD